MKSDLSPEAVAARLEALRRLYVPQHVDSLKDEPPSRDLSPATVAGRLDELRQLCDLARYLHTATPDRRKD